MFSMLIHLLPICALVAYVVAGLLYGRIVSKKQGGTHMTPRCVLCFGLILQLLFLILTYAGYYHKASITDGGASLRVIGFPTTLSVVSFLLGAVFLLFENRFKLSVLGVFLVPLGASFMLFSAMAYHANRQAQIVDNFGLPVVFHLGCCILAVVLFCLAFVVSVARVLQEHFLRGKQFTFMQRALPPLRVLDILNERFLEFGFVLMLIGVASGIGFAATAGIEFFMSDSRVVWSIATLLTYGLLLTVQGFSGWRGRRAAWGAIAGFVVLLASFVSLNVVGNTFHVY